MRCLVFVVSTVITTPPLVVTQMWPVKSGRRAPTRSMQATGIVNDHAEGCCLHGAVEAEQMEAAARFA